MTARLIVANLACEQDYARDPHRSRPADQLPRPVRSMLAASGALMAVFARDGDELWTPEPVQRDRLALDAAGRVRLVTGALAQQAWDVVLPWGETEAVTAARRPDVSHDAVPGADWYDALWRLHPSPAVARQANDRRYSLALARSLDIALPGSGLVASVDELEAHLRAGGHAAGHQGAWVVKAPFSASGRLRLRRRGDALDEPSRVRARRLLDRFETLVFEPWVDRIADFGCLGIVRDPSRWEIFAPHRLETDRAGVFRGIVIGGASLEPAASEQVRATARHVAENLAGMGYRGPFGIDGFAYRDRAGEVRVNPMCEINARLSFGFIARALARSYPDHELRLCMGCGAVPSRSSAADGRIVPLLHPGSDQRGDITSAWLELTAPA